MSCLLLLNWLTHIMSISVKCFASLREALKTDQTSIPYVSGMTVNQVWQAVTELPPPDNVLCARNHEYVQFDQIIADGDEIAFFPPVTGG